MIRAHRVRLDVTDKQATHLVRSCGTARFAYNWALARWGQEYAYSTYGMEDAVKPSQYSLRRELNAVKAEVFPWMGEVTKCAPQEAIIDLGKAFHNFFRDLKRGKGAKYPRFKKRGVGDSFRVSCGQFDVGQVNAGTGGVRWDRLRLPRLGWVRLGENFRYPGSKLVSVTISRQAHRWFASISVEIPDPPKPVRSGVVGVDVGVREIVTSDGVRYRVPREYRAAEKQLRRAQKTLSRRTVRGRPSSRNRDKATLRVARLHARTADIRRDWQHKLTTELASHYETVVIEDLSVKGMTKNRRLAKSILDTGFAEIRRQLEYKTTTMIIADRWFPSSKLCNRCGVKTKHLPLHIRQWACTTCNTPHDRDLNAAINLRNLAGVTGWQPVESSPPLTEPDNRNHQVTSTKQELDSKQDNTPVYIGSR